MSRFKEALRRDDDFIIIVVIFGIVCLVGFWPDITAWLGGLLPTGSGIARGIWQGVGILIGGGFLAAVYFATGMAGRRRPSGAHGIAGILTGFLLLLFVAAYLYSIGFVFWFSLLAGIAASLLLKMLFAYWRTRLAGTADPAAGTLRVSYRQRVIRRD